MIKKKLIEKLWKNYNKDKYISLNNKDGSTMTLREMKKKLNLN